MTKTPANNPRGRPPGRAFPSSIRVRISEEFRVALVLCQELDCSVHFLKLLGKH